jgi:hypothetical protein
MRPPEPQQNPDKFAPSNIFAAMKTKQFGQPEESQPQAESEPQECSVIAVEADLTDKYDALRPLTTGYNGAPGQQQPMGGMMPQQTGMGMGYPGMMMNQMTGFNPQQQGGGYGYGYR